MERNSNIVELRNSSKVSSVQRGVSHDWIIITDRADGPVPNVAEVYDDHTDDYEMVKQMDAGEETIAHFNEVA